MKRKNYDHTTNLEELAYVEQEGKKVFFRIGGDCHISSLFARDWKRKPWSHPHLLTEHQYLDLAAFGISMASEFSGPRHRVTSSIVIAQI